MLKSEMAMFSFARYHVWRLRTARVFRDTALSTFLNFSRLVKRLGLFSAAVVSEGEVNQHLQTAHP